MAKIKYDVSGVDPDKASSNFAQPTAGVYRVKVDSLTVRKPDDKDRRIEAVYKIVNDKKFKGASLFDYINLESEAAAWKLDQFLQAFGLATAKKRTGSLDTDDLIGKEIMCRVKGDTWNNEYRAKVGAIFALTEDDDEESEDADEDLEDADEDEAEDEDSEDDEDEDEDGEEAEEVDYSTWDISDLKALAKTRKIKETKKSLIIKALEKYDSENPFDE